MITVVVGVLCMAFGFWLGRHLANMAVLRMFDRFELGTPKRKGGVGCLR